MSVAFASWSSQVELNGYFSRSECPIRGFCSRGRGAPRAPHPFQTKSLFPQLPVVLAAGGSKRR